MMAAYCYYITVLLAAFQGNILAALIAATATFAFHNIALKKEEAEAMSQAKSEGDAK
jgi:uncharacterized protein (DUF697 family)